MMSSFEGKAKCGPADERAAAEFLGSVLRLKPGIATFDGDGTLWANDSGEEFFYWEIEQGLVPSDVARWALPRYAAYKSGRVTEEQNCIDSVIIHKGLREADIERAASQFVEQRVLPHIFPEMMELTHRLAATGCAVWLVSSTNLWVIRAAASHFGIAEARILATCVAIENGHATDRLIRVPTGEGKATAIQEAIAGSVDAAFGNSIHDLAMLALARHAFAVDPSPDLEPIARERGWSMYRPRKGVFLLARGKSLSR